MEGRKAAVSCSNSSSDMNRRKSFNGKVPAEDHKGGEELDKEWLGICVTAGELLYGEYPIEVLEASMPQRVRRSAENRCWNSSTTIP